MNQLRHRLTEVDLPSMTALCSICKDRVGIIHRGKKPNGEYKLRCRAKINAEARITSLRKKHGIEVGFVTPGDSCEICGGDTRIAYDHDHITGKFRGWLCMKCNTALGLANDSVIILERMVKYIQKAK